MAFRIDSLGDLLARARGNVAAEIAIELLLVPDYEQFVVLINRAVDRALRLMAENPELRKERSEDDLTIELVTLLKMASIDANHDTKVGGHCDVVVRGQPDYLWQAEAKKHRSDYAWLFQGFQQLNTRYATGAQHQDAGGFIIYSYLPRVDKMMSRWREHLGSNLSGISFEECTLSPLCFLSSHAHDRTGRALRIRHIPLSLYFEPKDHARARKAAT